MAWIRSMGAALPSRPIGLYELVGNYTGGGADPLNTDTRVVGPIRGTDYLKVSYKNTSTYQISFALQVSADNGVTWTEVYSLPNLNTQTVQNVNVSLASFAGQNIIVRFVFHPVQNLNTRTATVISAVIE